MKYALLSGLALVTAMAGIAAGQQPVTQPAAPIEDTANLDTDLGVLTDPDAAEAEIEALPQVQYEQFDGATIRALDKITGRSTDIDVEMDMPVIFGSLRVVLKTCYQTPPELPPESAAFFEVDGVQATQANSATANSAEARPEDIAAIEGERLFSGWMFASSPGLSALEHPVYDIWVIRCTTSAPVSGASGG